MRAKSREIDALLADPVLFQPYPKMFQDPEVAA